MILLNPLHRGDFVKKLTIRDIADEDIPDVDLGFSDQRQQQIKRAVKIFQLKIHGAGDSRLFLCSGFVRRFFLFQIK